ncbi:unnamed protein product [Rotaria magnacalcarata]|uniref:NHL repeat-containing protein n=2 Tax=Rotaria magnacalcarata TaxID=392030 RepID=A0A816ZU46_9BILA|nr:unnamed protein product [Rotaria magnacalcarata]
MAVGITIYLRSSITSKSSTKQTPLHPSWINIHPNATWIQNGLTVAGENESGNGTNQLNSPCGLYVYDDQTVYIADQLNNRIMKWKYGTTNGQVVAGGNGKGNGTNQLSSPRDVIVDTEGKWIIISDRGNKRVVRWLRQNGISGEIIIANIYCIGLTMDENGFLYVVDNVESEVRRYRIGDTEGKVVAGGNVNGNPFYQLFDPHYVFVDRNHSVYVSEFLSSRVSKWEEGAEEGIVIIGNQGIGNNLTQLYGTVGVIVDQLGTVYVTDVNNHRIMRWPTGAIQGTIIVGGNGQGKQSNQLYYPYDLSFDRYGNLYVVDFGNNRVQKFLIEQTTN